MDRYIVTLSGKRVSRTTGVPPLTDVFTGMCRTPMYAGQTRLFYSVAHHSLSAAELADRMDLPHAAFFVLLHEAEVCLVGDVPGPLKPDELRRDERGYRDRLFAELGTPLPPGMWDTVELYDKVEQAASARWLGLAETVHDAAYHSAPLAVRQLADVVTRRNYELFPPEKQLDPHAPLNQALLEKYKELRRKMP